MKNNILEEILSRKPPKSLYHYTTQEGLIGIIQKKEIWATHTQYLNDNTEYLHASDLVLKELKKRISNSSDENITNILNEMVFGVEGAHGMNVCVCSFSEISDSLSQWRAYSSAMSGFAIGFSGEELQESVKREEWFLVPCLYKENDHIELVNALIDKVLNENIKISDDEEDHVKLLQSGNMIANLNRYAPIIKNEKFDEEKEWRIISRPLSCKNDRFKYRNGKSMIIPYYCYPLIEDNDSSELPLNEIVVGPTPHLNQSRRSVESILAKEGLAKYPVECTKVPYRNW